MRRLLFLLSLLSLGGCMSMLGFDGPSSAKRKASVVSKSMFGMAILLETPANGVPSEPSRKLAAEILKTAFEDVPRIHRTQCTGITKDISEQAAACNVTPRIEIVDLGGPFVAASSDARVRADPRLAIAAYQSALLEVLREQGVPTFKAQRVLPEKPTDNEILAAFAALANEVRNAPVSGSDGVKFMESPTDAQKLEQDAWDRLDKLVGRNDEVRVAMAGALMFALAHEVGHIVLQHPSVSGWDFGSVRSAEELADVFAARLMFAGIRNSILVPYEALGSGKSDIQIVEALYRIPARSTAAFERPWFEPAAGLDEALLPQQQKRQSVLTAEHEKLKQDVEYREKEWTMVTIGWKTMAR